MKVVLPIVAAVDSFDLLPRPGAPDPVTRSVVLLGKLRTGDRVDVYPDDVLRSFEPAILSIQKSNFSSRDALATIMRDLEKVEVLEHNDIVRIVF